MNLEMRPFDTRTGTGKVLDSLATLAHSTNFCPHKNLTSIDLQAYSRSSRSQHDGDLRSLDSPAHTCALLVKESTLAQRRGNPTWGKGVISVTVSGPSSFERAVKHLKLRPEDYATSSRLKEWVRENKNHKYVPSELLAVWGFKVESEI
jgi:hypothetical protein